MNREAPKTISDILMLEKMREFHNSLPDVNHITAESEGLVIQAELSSEDPDIKSKINRTITSITAVVEKTEVDMCRDAPKGTIFKSIGAVKRIHYKYGPSISVSFASKEGENLIVAHDSEAFLLPGFALNHFHEIGHLWQYMDGKSDSARERNLLVSYKREEAKTSEIINAIKAVADNEIDAWRRSYEIFQKYLDKGINLAPGLSADELENYPQFYLDLYNYDFGKALNLVGNEHRLVWSRWGSN